MEISKGLVIFTRQNFDVIIYICESSETLSQCWFNVGQEGREGDGGSIRIFMACYGLENPVLEREVIKERRYTSFNLNSTRHHKPDRLDTFTGRNLIIRGDRTRGAGMSGVTVTQTLYQCATCPSR